MVDNKNEGPIMGYGHCLDALFRLPIRMSQRRWHETNDKSHAEGQGTLR